MSVWKRIKTFFKGQASWPEEPATGVQAARENMEQTTEQFADVLIRSREAVAQYGASVSQLEGEHQTLLQQKAELTRLIEENPDEPTVPQARVTLEQVDQRIEQIDRDLAQGRAAFDKLQEQLQLLQGKLNTAKLKLEDLKLQEATDETQAALDETLRDLKDPQS